jgi:flagellar motor protein MotB
VFRSAKADLRDEYQPLIAAIAQVIVENAEVIGRITVVGHTDSVPVQASNPFQSNQGLSEARAATIAKLLVAAGRALRPGGVGRPRRYRTGGRQRHQRGPGAEPADRDQDREEALGDAHPQGRLPLSLFAQAVDLHRRRASVRADLAVRAASGLWHRAAAGGRV